MERARSDENACVGYPALFELVTTLVIPSLEPFVSDNKFQKGEVIDGVFVGVLGEHFRQCFSGLHEPSIPESRVRVHRLCRPAYDSVLLDRLGGLPAVTIMLGQLWELIRVMDTRSAYVAYIRDTAGDHQAVYADRKDEGALFVESTPLYGPSRWDRGTIVFSPLLVP